MVFWFRVTMIGATIPRGPGPVPVPLIVRSAYSLARGTTRPERLLERAARLGFDTLALTDRDNLYGAVAFLRAARAGPVRAILGAEITPRTGPPTLPGEDGARGALRGACSSDDSVVVLVRDADGYGSLCAILTARHLAASFDLAACVAAHGKGIVVLARDAAMLRRLDPDLPRDTLYAAVVRPAADRGGEVALRKAAAAAGRPIVGTIDVYVGSPEEWETHRLLAAVREGELVSRLSPDRVASRGRTLPAAAEIFDLFTDDPEGLAAARRLAEGCRFEGTDLPQPGSLLPRLPLPKGESAYDRLYRMTQDGLRRRYRRVTPKVAARLAWELEQIDGQGFTDYFVVVGDICAAARANGIPTVGRGSGASSIVSYLLGITNVDPIRYRLTFERFLHRLRHDLPDLDIDLCWRRRDDVIRHVYETYGADRVAMISTHNHYQSRGAFREAAKAAGFTSEQVDRFARAIPSFSDQRIEPALRATPLGRTFDLDSPPMPEAMRGADRLIGLPHTMGIHCGGIVIAPDRLDRWVPLEMATKGIVVTQYEMHGVEAVGLVKIDLLGNRALSTIAETVAEIGDRGGKLPDLDAAPHDDARTAALLRVGDTLGCFQIESPGMRNLLRMLRTDDLDGTIAALSLIRPGPAGSGMKNRFVRRSRGLEPTRYLHPSLEPLLASTHGILLYEEDVITVASAIGGFDRAVGDLLRRAIASATAVGPDASLGERATVGWAERNTGADPWKGKPMRELENRFIACAVGSGVDADVARRVWAELARFGSYAFCKAHASGYGLLAYQATYLKAHHPGPFYAALLNNHQGIYPRRVHVEDARRRGVRLAPPCVHESSEGWAWDGSALRCGLGQVRGLTRPTLAAVLRERGLGRFEDLDDFLDRTGATLPEATALILCGALDEVGPGPRPARLWRLQCRARLGRSRRGRGGRRLGLPRSAEVGDGPWKRFTPAEKVRHELETLEVAISAHPVHAFCRQLEEEGAMPSHTPAGNLAAGGPVRLIGLIAATRRVRTKRGETMLFLTLEDPSGLGECILFPDVYKKYGHRIDRGAVLLAEGTVEAPYGAPTVTVTSIRRLAPQGEDGLIPEGRPISGGATT